MFAARVDLFREGDIYIPAINVHQDDCKRHKGCCHYSYQKCDHLATTNLEEGRKRARSLAVKIGVPCSA